MSDEKPEPIPQSLVDAFGQAVACYDRTWSPDDPSSETEVIYEGKAYPFSAIFGFAEYYSDRMPDELQRFLAGLRGGGDLGDLSYRSGAKYLLTLMRDRKERHEEVQNRPL